MLAPALQEPAALVVQVAVARALALRHAAAHELLLAVPPGVRLERVPAEAQAGRLDAHALLRLVLPREVHVDPVLPGLVVLPQDLLELVLLQLLAAVGLSDELIVGEIAELLLRRLLLLPRRPRRAG